MSFIKTFKDGIKYMEIWPEDPILGSIFTEGRVKYILLYVKKQLAGNFMLRAVFAFAADAGILLVR